MKNVAARKTRLYSPGESIQHVSFSSPKVNFNSITTIWTPKCDVFEYDKCCTVFCWLTESVAYSKYRVEYYRKNKRERDSDDCLLVFVCWSFKATEYNVQAQFVAARADDLFSTLQSIWGIRWWVSFMCRIKQVRVYLWCFKPGIKQRGVMYNLHGAHFGYFVCLQFNARPYAVRVDYTFWGNITFTVLPRPAETFISSQHSFKVRLYKLLRVDSQIDTKC